MSLESVWRWPWMLNFAYFQVVSSRRDGRRTKMHVGRRLSCCNEENVIVSNIIDSNFVHKDPQRRKLRTKSPFFSTGCYELNTILHGRTDIQQERYSRGSGRLYSTSTTVGLMVVLCSRLTISACFIHADFLPLIATTTSPTSSASHLPWRHRDDTHTHRVIAD